jgi:endonuclease YncB( thermonuclease family)
MLLGKVIAVGLGIVLVVWLVVGAFRKVHYGEATVVGTGVLSIEGREYSLWAVKIPEVAETCSSQRGAWPCGAFAAAALVLEVTDKSVVCFGKAERAERILPAKCYASGNLLVWKDVSRELVKQGWAKPNLAVSREYEPISRAAATDTVGLWKR